MYVRTVNAQWMASLLPVTPAFCWDHQCNGHAESLCLPSAPAWPGVWAWQLCFLPTSAKITLSSILSASQFLVIRGSVGSFWTQHLLSKLPMVEFNSWSAHKLPENSSWLRKHSYSFHPITDRFSLLNSLVHLQMESTASIWLEDLKKSID